LIVHGKQDDVVPYAWSKRLEQQMPNVHLHAIENAKHRITENPHAFETERALDNWLMSEKKLLKR
jgi:pimeloyl-ACP methyl ester carboxylesterase